MTYKEAIDYIRYTAAFGGKLGLDNIRTLMSLLGDPQKSLKFIHIAGTNGKGSVAAYMLSILEHAGYRVGFYTSPELSSFSERIRINETEIPGDDIAFYMTEVRSKAEYMTAHDMGSPSEFELVLAMAFLYFLDQQVDMVILEVGLGGRLDATNVIDNSMISVITRISYDHMQYLGNTLPEIAYEKASIIKSNGTVIVYPADKEVIDVYIQQCSLQNALLKIADLPVTKPSHTGLSPDLTVREFVLSGKTYCTKMLASYEADNAALAIQAINLIRGQAVLPGLSVSEDDIYEGIKKAYWPGRFDILSQDPLIIADGAHNEDGAIALSKTLTEYFGSTKLTLCIGILRDKQYKKMLSHLLPLAERVLVCEVPNPRTLLAEELSSVISDMDPEMEILSSKTPEDAYDTIKKLQHDAAAIIICGSLYLVGPLRALILTD